MGCLTIIFSILICRKRGRRVGKGEKYSDERKRINRGERERRRIEKGERKSRRIEKRRKKKRIEQSRRERKRERGVVIDS